MPERTKQDFLRSQGSARLYSEPFRGLADWGDDLPSLGRGHAEHGNAPGNPSSAAHVPSGLALRQLETDYRIKRLMDGGGIWRASLQFSGEEREENSCASLIWVCLLGP